MFLSHTPAGASTYQLLHYAQAARTKRFHKYDWGTWENLARYGRVTPPDYKLHNVQVRVILHYADNDWLASPIDVHRLYAKLPNAQLIHVPDTQFEHMDFVWGIETRQLIYKPIIRSLELYDKLAHNTISYHR